MERAELVEHVERAQRGDLAAFDALVREFQDTVAATAMGWLRDTHLAADVAQDTFLDVFRQLPELREPAAFPGWLRTIAIKHCDRITRRPRILPGAEAREGADPSSGPEGRILSMEDDARVVDALEALSTKERLVMALHYLADMSGPEIAAYLDLSLPVVKKRLHSARSHLREQMEKESPPMTRRAFRALRPSRSDALATTVQLFLAIRAGDVGRVKALLDAAPSLVGAHENWSGEEAEGAGIPYAASATPLVRAVERDQQEVVTLLLERGADANGACGCAGGEAPLWSAVVHARPRLVVTLLDGGADPNRPAFRGQRPLHVAASRGYAEIVDTLLARGADPALTDDEGRTARDWAEVNGHPSVCLRLGETAKAARVNLRRPAQLRADRWETGIRALDLLCPLPRHGIARWEGGPGVGSMVLLIEIVARCAPVVDGVVWGGIEPSPGDRNDLVQDLREQGADAEVDVLLASRDCSPQARRDLLRVAADRAYAHAARGGALLILQSERGLQSDVEAVLPAIDREAGGPLTTIVIAPPTQPDPVPGLHRPYVSLAAFDLERAKVGQWPALDLSRSTTSLHLSAEHRRVLGDLRAAIDAGSSAGRACGWYLAQPFYTTEPFSSLPGEWTPVDDTIRKLARIIEEAPGADRTD